MSKPVSLNPSLSHAINKLPLKRKRNKSKKPKQHPWRKQWKKEKGMKALTICQPYAHLIASGAKWIENRRWATGYRGPLAIHAGKNRNWLDIETRENGEQFDCEYDILLSEMHFGFVVAIAELVDCLPLLEIISEDPYEVSKGGQQFGALRNHEHTRGPFCWELANVRKIEPFACSGKQGLWNVELPEVEA